MKKLWRAILIPLFIASIFVTGANGKTIVGWASFYKTGKFTANGERFLPLGLTAAHRDLPFDTLILVTNLKNGKSVVVRINDRGPALRGRILDLSFGAAKVLELDRMGVAQIAIEEVGD